MRSAAGVGFGATAGVGSRIAGDEAGAWPGEPATAAGVSTPGVGRGGPVGRDGEGTVGRGRVGRGGAGAVAEVVPVLSCCCEVAPWVPGVSSAAVGRGFSSRWLRVVTGAVLSGAVTVNAESAGDGACAALGVAGCFGRAAAVDCGSTAFDPAGGSGRTAFGGTGDCGSTAFDPAGDSGRVAFSAADGWGTTARGAAGASG